MFRVHQSADHRRPAEPYPNLYSACYTVRICMTHRRPLAFQGQPAILSYGGRRDAASPNLHPPIAPVGSRDAVGQHQRHTSSVRPSRWTRVVRSRTLQGSRGDGDAARRDATVGASVRQGGGRRARVSLVGKSWKASERVRFGEEVERRSSV